MSLWIPLRSWHSWFSYLILVISRVWCFAFLAHIFPLPFCDHSPFFTFLYVEQSWRQEYIIFFMKFQQFPKTWGLAIFFKKQNLIIYKIRPFCFLMLMQFILVDRCYLRGTLKVTNFIYLRGAKPCPRVKPKILVIMFM